MTERARYFEIANLPRWLCQYQGRFYKICLKMVLRYESRLFFDMDGKNGVTISVALIKLTIRESV